MSLRTIPTLDGSAPIAVVIVTRQEVSFNSSSVVVNSVNDDGVNITANITFTNGMSKVLILFTGGSYAAIATFSDAQINAAIVANLNN